MDDIELKNIIDELKRSEGELKNIIEEMKRSEGEERSKRKTLESERDALLSLKVLVTMPKAAPKSRKLSSADSSRG